MRAIRDDSSINAQHRDVLSLMVVVVLMAKFMLLRVRGCGGFSRGAQPGHLEAQSAPRQWFQSNNSGWFRLPHRK